MAWHVDEYERHERGPWWYVIVGAVMIGLLMFAVFAANFLFAVILAYGWTFILHYSHERTCAA